MDNILRGAFMAEIIGEQTITFSIKNEKERQMHKTLSDVYHALVERGYNPVNQIVGYILSEDPTYITNHNNARSEIRKIDRDDLLKVMVQHYLSINRN